MDDENNIGDIIDFDRIALWAPLLSAELLPHLPDNIAALVKNAEPEFVQDALEIIFEPGDRSAIVEKTQAWVSDNSVAAYHGSRLSDSEISSVLSGGIKALNLPDRRDSLRRTLQDHPLWTTAEGKFESTVQDFGDGCFGRREGQAHLTISRGALTYDFNEYLKGGSEFDRVVTLSVLGREAQKLLIRNRDPVIFRVVVPGGRALDASSRWLPAGDIPGLVRHFLQYWAFSLFDATIATARERVDCGIMFYEDIPASWIAKVIRLSDQDLDASQ